MPAIGLLFLLAEIACAVHVMRTGRNPYWIYLVVFIPVVGMAAYLLVEILPDLSRSRTARRAALGMAKAINPGKALREAMRRAQMTPTAENKAALAEAHLQAGQPAEAVALYREALTGIHATDPGMMLGLAEAEFLLGRPAEAQSVLDRLREANPDYNSAAGHLLYARSLEAQGKVAEALAEYEALVAYYPGQEARCRYGLLLRQNGREAEARQLFEEVCRRIQYGPRYQRRMQREWYSLARRELAA